MSPSFPTCGAPTRLAVLALLSALFAASWLSVAPAAAQAPTREYPPGEYYTSLDIYDEGEFASALKAFRNSARGGIRSTEGRWVDSICYYTMMGECLYQMGNLGDALDQYTAALNLFVAYRHWMLRVDFPPVLEPSAGGLRRPPTWGASGRRAVMARLPSRYPILQGRPDNERVLTQGGIVALPEYYLINAHEIARCTALAIRRRHEIMGVACQYDPFTRQVLQALTERPAPPNHWSQAWVRVKLGLAYAAANQIPTAILELNQGLLAAERFDHPLTPTALLELGKLSFRQEQYSAAAKSFYEATISGAMFAQYDLIEEAFRWAVLTHLVTGQKGIYPPLASASDWARREAPGLLEVSLLTLAAQNSVEMNQTAAAAALEKQARLRMGRREMAAGAVGARLNYATALIHYQGGSLKSGDAAFTALMAYQSHASQRLFEINLVDRLYASGVFSDRIAGEQFARVLREPTTKDWAVDPVETLSVVLTPQMLPLEHWFDIAIKRKESDLAIEIADRIRRHRFFTTLPMGGRLLSLRWVLEASPAAIGDAATLQRQDLLASFPNYAALSKQAAAIRAKLDVGPLLPDAEDARREQVQALAELGAVSLAQEVMLREMALRRWPSEFVFPPLLDFKKTQAQLPEGVLVLSFLETSRHAYAFALGRDSYAHWRLQAPASLRRSIVELLREMGHIDRNQPLDVKQLADGEWKSTAAAILAQVTNNAKPQAWEAFDELVIVPDGALWYLPFEALQIVDGSTSLPLISKVRVRYVPTVSLALPDKRRAGPVAKTAVVAGLLYPRNDPAVADRAVAELQEVLPRVTRLSDPLPAPSGLFTTLCDRLVVLADMDDRSRSPYDWAPLQFDQGKVGSAISDWIALPWGGPQQVVLPGFHTAAEYGLKRGGTGSEVFLAVCGMMASGSRTALISRWRTGGKTSYDLTREFVQELPYGPAADAWQRSVQLVRSGELDLDFEPRIKAVGLESGLRAEHPFFWSGYLLVDTGAAAGAADAAPDAVADAKDPAE